MDSAEFVGLGTENLSCLWDQELAIWYNKGMIGETFTLLQKFFANRIMYPEFIICCSGLSENPMWPSFHSQNDMALIFPYYVSFEVSQDISMFP